MIAVVGGGLIGACVAFELNQRGEDVLVLDADLPGAAWRAGAGLLSPSGERLNGTPLERDALESLGLWPDFARRLEEVSGQSVGFRLGVYRVAFDEEEAQILNADTSGEAVATNGDQSFSQERGLRSRTDSGASSEDAKERGLRPFPSDEAELCSLPGNKTSEDAEERGLCLLPNSGTSSFGRGRKPRPFDSDNSTQSQEAPTTMQAPAHLSAARFHALEGQVHPPSVRAAALSGLRVVRARVERIEPLETGVCLHLDSGQTIETSLAVLCCGAWSGAFGLPVRAVQGQALLLDASPDLPALYGPPQKGSSSYALGRPDGLYIGATSRDSETNETCPDSQAASALRDKARRLWGEGEAAGAPLLKHLVGFRPTTTDGLPLIERHPTWPNVIVATGHSRHGVLLAPLTARRVYQLAREALQEQAGLPPSSNQANHGLEEGGSPASTEPLLAETNS